MGQAPSGDVGIGPEHFDAARVRHEEARWREQGRVGQTVAAVAPDGTLAGHTQLVVPDHGETAYQWDTLVLPAHRGHGLGLALHERPIISRLVSLKDPMEIKTGMVFALETYCPATDGMSAARIEEEVVVTDTGCQVITLFPAEELPVANRY